RQEDVERAQRARRELAAQRLDPDPDEGAERAGLQPLGAFLSGLGGVAVLLGVAADSVAVLEIDAEVLHRFALQLLLDPRVDDLGDAGIDPDRLRESAGVRRVLRERLEREVSELLRGVALEQVRATVDGVHGLAGPGLARIVARERILLRLQARADLAEGLLGGGGLRHGPCLSTLPPRRIPLGRRSGVRRTVPWPFQAAFSGQSRARGICKVPRFARSGPLLFGLMQAEADSILGARRRKGGGAKSIRIDGRNALHGRRAQTHVAGSLH